MARRSGFLAALMTLLYLAVVPSAAQTTTWPSRPVYVIAPYAPGGLTDAMVRLTAAKLSVEFGQTFVVDNRIGAGGAIGTEYAARQAPDGYSLYFASGAQFNVLPLIQKVVYNPDKQFVPVGIVGYVGNACAINPSVPAKSVPEFVNYAKNHPGEISFGIAGIGTYSQLVPASLMARTGIQMVQVPYTGSAQALNDLIAGRIQLLCVTATDFLPFADDARIRILGLTTETRLPDYPNIPTFAETYPDFVLLIWDAYFVQTGTPKQVISKLSDGIKKIAKDHELIERFSKLGITTLATTPEETASIMQKDAPVMAEAVRAAGLKRPD